MTKDESPVDETPLPLSESPDDQTLPASSGISKGKRKRRGTSSEAGPSTSGGSSSSPASSSSSSSASSAASTDQPSQKKSRSFPRLFSVPGIPKRRSFLKAPLEAPERLAINHLIHIHGRTRLYVRALLWTVDQLQLLQCRFQLAAFAVPESIPFIKRVLDAEDHPMISGGAHERCVAICENFIAACEAISEGSDDMYHVLSILRLFGADMMFLPKTRSPFWDLPLQFGGYDADRLQTDGVYTHPSYRRYVPCIATLHLDSLTVRRDVVCGLNKAPSNLYKRVKRRQIEPDNELHDPFIAALLISLAQLRRRDLSMYREERRKAARIAQTGSTMSASAQSPTSTPKYDHANPDPEEPPSFDALVLILTPSVESQAARGLYIYKASVSTGFLNKLEYPSKHFGDQPLVITYFRLPTEYPEDVAGVLEKYVFPAESQAWYHFRCTVNDLFGNTGAEQAQQDLGSEGDREDRDNQDDPEDQKKGKRRDKGKGKAKDERQDKGKGQLQEESQETRTERFEDEKVDMEQGGPDEDFAIEEPHEEAHYLF